MQYGKLYYFNPSKQAITGCLQRFVKNIEFLDRKYRVFINPNLLK